MEYWDLYDQNRIRLHQIHEKGQPIPQGAYHLIADVWILTPSGKYLISQRTAHKHHGLSWECPGGSVQSQETTVEGAIREVFEELGIVLCKENLILIDTCKIPDRFVDTYLVRMNISLDDVKKQEDEVRDVKLADIEEIDVHWNEGMFSPKLRYQRYRDRLVLYAKETRSCMEAKWYNTLPEEAVAIRTEVFMNEQGFRDEFDETDATCLHVVIWNQDTFVACGRLILEADCAHLGRIAVLKPYRKQKVGSFLVNRMTEKAKEIGCKYVWLSAQSRVQDFYKSLGFITEGEEYMDEHCPHVNMKKPIG